MQNGLKIRFCSRFIKPTKKWNKLTEKKTFINFTDAPPILLYSFIEQTLQPGPAVSLKCSAAGNPTPQVLWTLDGFPLPTNGR